MTTSVQRPSGDDAWVDLSHQVWSLSGNALIEIPGDQEMSTLSVQYVSSMVTGGFRDLTTDAFDLDGDTSWDLAEWFVRTNSRRGEQIHLPGDSENRALSQAAIRIALSREFDAAARDLIIVPTMDPSASPDRREGRLLSGVIPSSEDIASRWGVTLTDIAATWSANPDGVGRDMETAYVVAERLRELPIPVYGSPPSGIKDFAGWLSSSGGFSYAIAHTAADSLQEVAVYMGFLTPAVAVGFKLAWPAVDNLSKKIDQWTGETFGVADERIPKRRPVKKRRTKPPVKKRKKSGDH